MAEGIQPLFPVYLARQGSDGDEQQKNDQIAVNENALNQNFEILYNGLSETKALIDANLDAMQKNIANLTQAVNAMQQTVSGLQSTVSGQAQTNQYFSGAIDNLQRQIESLWRAIGF